MLAHVPRSYWRVAATFEHEGNRYEGTWFDPAFDAGDDPDRKDDRIFDAERASAIAAARERCHRARERDAQAVARIGPAAVRSHEPAARGESPLLVVGAAHAVGRAALLRAPQGAHLPAHELEVSARGLPRDGRGDDRVVRGEHPPRRGIPRSRGRGRAAARERSRERGAHLRQRRHLRSLRDRPDRIAAARAAHGRRQAPVRSGGAPFLRRVPPARAVGARRAHDRGRRRELPHACAHARRAGLALGARRQQRRGGDAAARAGRGRRRGERRRGALDRSAEPVGRDQASRADHRSAAALAHGERGTADRRRGVLGGPAREGHRHARHARRHHREPDRQGLRGADRQGAAPHGQGHPDDRHAAPDPHRSPDLARADRRDRVPPARGRARRAYPQRVHERDHRLHGRDRRSREDLRLRRALRRERDVRQLPVAAGDP